jgi:hypothetical protein
MPSRPLSADRSAAVKLFTRLDIAIDRRLRDHGAFRRHNRQRSAAVLV